MDGTLVDSEPLWQSARNSLAARYGVAWDSADHDAAIGHPLNKSAEKMRERGISLSLDEINMYLVDFVAGQIKIDPHWRPGARELLSSLNDAGVANALVTMAFRPVAEAVAANAAASGGFAVIVAGDEVTRGKPHPEAYLIALKQLRMSPEKCIAIEDTLTGVSSAHAAGVVVIAVPYMSPLTDLPPVEVRDSLSAVSVEDLEELVGRH